MSSAGHNSAAAASSTIESLSTAAGVDSAVRRQFAAMRFEEGYAEFYQAHNGRFNDWDLPKPVAGGAGAQASVAEKRAVPGASSFARFVGRGTEKSCSRGTTPARLHGPCARGEAATAAAGPGPIRTLPALR